MKKRAEAKPLTGRKILVTRPRHQSRALAKPLEALGAEVIPAPAIRIEPPDDFAPLDAALSRLEDYDWLVFTSVNGVDAFFERCTQTPRVRIAAIGPATADAIRERGAEVELTPPRFVAEALVQALSEHTSLGGKRFLIPRADIARETLPRSLSKAGASVDVVVAYRTVYDVEEVNKSASLVEQDVLDAVTFTSGSTVRSFYGNIPPRIHPLVRAASIGPITSHALREYGVEPKIEAEAYTTEGLVEAIAKYFSEGEPSR